MPTPKAGYFLSDGTRVPGTTTVISRFKESGALIAWAWNLGREGKDYREVRDKAATVGTIAHDMVDCQIHGRPVLVEGDPEMVAKAHSAFEAYLEWASMSKLEIIETECQLVSEEYRFGGTPDAIGRIGNRIVLLDWKTSNSVYQDYLIQLAAYKHLIEANRDYRIEGFHLCRFAKEHGDFSHHYYPNLDEAWRAFILMRELYEIDKQLKKRAA